MSSINKMYQSVPFVQWSNAIGSMLPEKELVFPFSEELLLVLEKNDVALVR